MNAMEAIQAAMKTRTEAGLHLRIFGEKAEAEGVCEHQFAVDQAQLDRWIASVERRGYEYEIIR